MKHLQLNGQLNSQTKLQTIFRIFFNTRIQLVTALLLSVQLFGFVGQAHAEGDYDFNWLDPDKKIYVLQNRKYEKAGGAHFSILGGMGFGDTYRMAYYVQPRFGVWFNEDFGIEGFYGVGFHNVNGAYEALDQAIGTASSPIIREIKGMWGLMLNWAPWYAKINVFNSILYFDWIFSGGAGMLQADVGRDIKNASWGTENLFSFYLGTGQMFHLSQSVTFRIDFLGYIYKAPTFGGLANAPLGDSWFSNFVGSVGFGFKL